jgi:hypothetical protein
LEMRMKIYIFRPVPLSIIKSQFTVHSEMVYVIQVCRQLCHISLPSVQRITPDDGHRNCPKHVEFHFHFQNKFEKLLHLVGFIIRNFFMLHGHMNVK